MCANSIPLIRVIIRFGIIARDSQNGTVTSVPQVDVQLQVEIEKSISESYEFLTAAGAFEEAGDLDKGRGGKKSERILQSY